MANSLQRIRTLVLGVTQAEFARAAGTTQATVSRWERGGLKPSLSHLEAVRSEVRRRGLVWDDSWFFDEAPNHHAPGASDAA